MPPGSMPAEIRVRRLERLAAPELAVEIMGLGRRREGLDDQERRIDIVGAPAAGDGDVR